MDTKTPISVPVLSSENFGSYPLDPKDPWWIHPDRMDVLRWNQYFPYQIIAVRKNKDSSGNVGIRPPTARGMAIIPGVKFTLPIPPRDIMIQTPYAIETSVTNGGVVEEHNGAPIKIITFSGSTGVLPVRQSSMVAQNQSLAESIFAGTVKAGRALMDTVNSLTDLTSGVNPEFLMPTPTPVDNYPWQSGYVQFRLLERFLENYANAKKIGKILPSGIDPREMMLALAIWKDEAVYLVTPASLYLTRSSRSPYEYNYQLTFKAWRRVKVEGVDMSTAIFRGASAMREPSMLAKSLRKVQDASRAVQGSLAMIRAVSPDIKNTVCNSLRTMEGLIKNVAGIPQSLADINNAAIFDYLSTQKGLRAFIETASNSPNVFYSGWKNLVESVDQLQRAFTGRDLSQKFDTAEVYTTLSQMPIDYTAMSVKSVAQIHSEAAQTMAYTRNDFTALRDGMVTAVTAIADKYGMGDVRYNTLYRRSVSVASQSPSDKDYELVASLWSAITVFDSFAAYGIRNDAAEVTAIDVVAGLASKSGIAFQKPVSKYAVPFPYGGTLENLAATYLGDPDRWYEIAALNGLRAPYVDEQGVALRLTVNGNQNSVVIDATENVYVGQSVWIGSDTKTRTKRRVLSVSTAHGYTYVTVDGAADLGDYKTYNNAVLEMFLPGTVNSQMMIYIPSQNPAAEDGFRTRDIPGVNQFDPLLSVGGVDLLVDESGDLIITPDGDNRWAYGMTAIVQRLRTSIGVRQGALLHHPEFGIPLATGDSTVDVDAAEIARAIRATFGNDPTFSDVAVTNVTKNGNHLAVHAVFTPAGVSQNVPVSFEIRI